MLQKKQYFFLLSPLISHFVFTRQLPEFFFSAKVQKVAILKRPLFFRALVSHRSTGVQSSQFLKLGKSAPTYFFKLCYKVHMNILTSEKATEFCAIFNLLLTGTTQNKSKVEISQNFVAFSEYMNFSNNQVTRTHIVTPF